MKLRVGGYTTQYFLADLHNLDNLQAKEENVNVIAFLPTNPSVRWYYLSIYCCCWPVPMVVFFSVYKQCISLAIYLHRALVWHGQDPLGLHAQRWQ